MSHHPEVKWAEREDKVFLTVLLPDAKDADVKLDPESVFNFSAKAGPENQLYELKLELNDKVNIEESKINIGLRSIFCILEKAEPKWWNKLLRGGKPPHYVKVDWDKWVDKDEDAGTGHGDMDMGGMGGVVPSGTVGKALGRAVDEFSLVERPAEQTSAGLPVNVEKSVEPAHTEKSKKKTSKRQRTCAFSDKEKSLSTGRHIDYKDVGFVEDKKVCANLLYALKHPEASANVPLLSELEESEAYARYARSQMRSQAFLNKIIVDYQRKLDDARQAPKNTEHSKKLKADFERQCIATARLAEKLKEKNDENNSLHAELAETRSLADKQLVELKALGEYSKVVKARADRLRERHVYLNKVRVVSKRANQARSTWKCVQGLAKAGVKIPQRVLDDIEKDALGLEAKFKEFEPVELEEGDLSPLRAYVPHSDEFEGLLGIQVPSD